MQSKKKRLEENSCLKIKDPFRNSTSAFIRKLVYDKRENMYKKQPWKSEDDDLLSSLIADMLINHGANIYIKNKNKQTAMELCSDPDFIEFLIKRFR